MVFRTILRPVLVVGILFSFSCSRAESDSGARAESRPGPVPPPGDVLRFKMFRIMDRPDMIGGEAVSMLIPAGWEGEGAVVWRLHPTMPAGAQVRFRNPAGPEAFDPARASFLGIFF